MGKFLFGVVRKIGVKDLYLFGFGTYHNHNIIENLKKFCFKKFKNWLRILFIFQKSKEIYKANNF